MTTSDSDNADEPGPFDGWMNAEQAARYSGYSPQTIRRLCTRKLLRHARTGMNGQYRFRREWIDEYMLARTTEPKTIVIPPPRQRGIGVEHLKSASQRLKDLAKSLDAMEVKDRYS